MKYNSQEYYDSLNGKKVICVDFDNTVCIDEWPWVGPVIPEAFMVLKELQDNGHKIILFTQRGYHYPINCPELEEYAKDKPEYDNGDGTVDLLTPAKEVFAENGIELYGINKNPTWEYVSGDKERKIYSDYFIDDHSAGMHYLDTVNRFGETCNYCCWLYIDSFFKAKGLYNRNVLMDNQSWKKKST